MTFEACLAEQAAAHPTMAPQDAVKLCYQAAFGAEHLLGDREEAARRLTLELESVLPSPGPLWEPVSPRFARVNLAVWKERGLPAERLCELFLSCAAQPACPDGEALFRRYLEAVGSAAGADALPFSDEAWREYLAGYLARGGGPVHHSARYREAEQPHYRLLPLSCLEKIFSQQALDSMS